MTVMHVYVMMVVKGDGPEREGESVMMKGDNMTVVYWVHQLHAGGFMRLMGGAEDRSGWCFQVKHLKGVINTLADGETRWDSSTLLEELTNRTPDVKL